MKKKNWQVLFGIVRHRVGRRLGRTRRVRSRRK